MSFLSGIKRVLGPLSLLGFLTLSFPASAQIVGPTPYLQFSDRPLSFQGSFSSYFLEDFEDENLTPGWSADEGGRVSVVFGPNIHDSVDEDDGSIDGSGLNGDDWFSGTGAVTFTFDPLAFGGQYPTHVGIVWTDGSNPISFQAFDPGLVLIGSAAGDHADGSFNGETAEDRFYGMINPAGIRAIRIANGGGLEVDHLQYGFAADSLTAPEPGSLVLAVCGSIGFVSLLRRRK